MIIKNKE